MGKKQKIANQQKPKIQTIESVEKTANKLNQSQKIAKLGKKEKRKQKRLQKRASNNGKKKVSVTQQEIEQIQQEQNNIEVVDEQDAEEDIQQSQSLIEISSSQQEGIQQEHDDDIELNPKKLQGFDSLVGQTDQKISSQAKCIQITRNTTQPFSPQLYHIFHLKKQIFYKVTSLTHQRLNTTHLNETANLKIIDQNLLKNGNSEEQGSTLFWLNGKLVQREITFVKSTVFRVVENNNNSKSLDLVKTNSKDINKKKNKSNGLTQKLRQNIEKYIKPISSEQTHELLEFLRDFEWKEDCLIISKDTLTFTQTTAPFPNIDQKMLTSNNSLLIIGKKNTGKSTLAEYLKNTNPDSICILDCDIGRSLSISGCVSLLVEGKSINLWIGEFTPFNCIKTYVSAIKKLYQFYREKYFSRKLVINTMGYLSGVGEMALYEIYHLINPSEIIVLNSQSQNTISSDNISNIIRNLKTGNYLGKLLTLSSSDTKLHELRQFSQKKLNLNIQYLFNEHAQGKGIPIRFENLLMYKKNIKSIVELIRAIKRNNFQCLAKLPLYDQDKLGNLVQLNTQERKHADMRIVLIGKRFEAISNNDSKINTQADDADLFRVFGIGFGYEGKVYFSKEQIETVLSPFSNLKDQMPNLRGILSEGVDFEKNFYLVNQHSLIQLELQYGDVPYMLPIIKGMGSKGTRNNPSKNA